MTASQALPARPSLESLRKQAKKLARETASGDAGAIARARAHVPSVDLPLTQRSAQLIIARGYGYAGWQDLIAEVSKRLGKGLECAVGRSVPTAGTRPRLRHHAETGTWRHSLAPAP